MLYVDVSSTAAEKSLGNLARELGVSMSDMIVEQSRLTAQGLLQRTPPLNSSMKISQKAGRDAIKKDLRMIFNAADYYLNAGAVSWTDLQTRRVMFRLKGGGIFGVPIDRYHTRINTISGSHQKERNRRTGRVQSDLGRERYMIDTARLFARYQGTVFKRMGQLASGWLPALQHFAAKSKISKGMRVPGFVAKQANKIRGKYVDRTGYWWPYAVITNYWRFGYSSSRASLYAQVTRERELDAVKWMRKRLKKLVETRMAA